MANVALFFDETGFGGSVGSDEAWAHVVAWEDSLPEDQYHTIHQLVANGWEDDLPGLEEDIRSAMEAEPPDPEVETTLNEFLSTLEDRGEDDTALAISLSEEPDLVVLELPSMGDTAIDIENADSSSLTGGRWVTIEGVHVYIKGGKIVAGPAALEGHSPGDLKSIHREATDTEKKADAASHKAASTGSKADHVEAMHHHADASHQHQQAAEHPENSTPEASKARAESASNKATEHAVKAGHEDTLKHPESQHETQTPHTSKREALEASDRAADASDVAHDGESHRAAAAAHREAAVAHATTGDRAAAARHAASADYHDRKAGSDTATAPAHTIPAQTPKAPVSRQEALQATDRAADASDSAHDAGSHSAAAAAHREAAAAHASTGDSATAAKHEASAAYHDSKVGAASKTPAAVKAPEPVKPAHETPDHFSREDVDGKSLKKLEELVKKHATSSGSVRSHGMAGAEDLHHVKMDGVRFHFKNTAAGRAAVVRTLGSASMKLGGVIPEPLWKAQTDVIHTSQNNKDSAHFGERYNKKDFKIGATGGQGKVVVYNGKSMSKETLAHESGHNLAEKIWGSAAPKEHKEGDYARAQRQEKAVSEYGGTMHAEDFAEATRMYTTDKESLRQNFPKKFKALEDILVKRGHQPSPVGNIHNVTSKEQEQVVLDLPTMDGSIRTVDVDHLGYWEGVPIIHEQGFTGNARKKLPSQQLDITPEKACKILKDGEVRGHPLTERQRGLFGVICGRRGKQTANSEHDSVTRNEGSEKLPSSAYAYVPHVHRPGTWKLRIDGPKHVSASIAALSKAGVPAGHLPGIKKKLRAAWRKFFPDKDAEDMPEVIRNVEYDQDDVNYELALDELTQMVEDGELPAEVFNMVPGAPGPMSEPAYVVGSGPQTASGNAMKARDASRKAHEASLRTSAAPLESRMALDAADRAVGHAQSGNRESAREDHRSASAAHLSASAHHKLLSSPGPAPAPDSGLVAHAGSQMLPSISGVLATPLPTLEGDNTATRSAQSDLGTVIDMTGLASAHSNASALHEQAADLHADAYDELEPAPTSGIALPEDDKVTLSEDGTITLSQDETPGTLLSMWPNRARIATASSRRAHMATASIEGVSKGSMKESAEAVSDADEAENASRDENLRGRSKHKSAMKAHESLARYHKDQAGKASKAGNKGLAVSHTTASQLHEEAATAHDDAYDEAGKPLSNEVYDPDLGLLKTD